MNPERRRILLGLLALVVASVVAGSRVRFDLEVLNLLPQDLPAVHALKLHQRHFANANELLVLVEHSEAGAAVEAAGSLAAALREQPRHVRSAVWQPLWEEHPEQSAELLALLWLNQPGPGLTQLRERLAQPAQVLAAVRERLATALSPEEIGRLSYDPYGFSEAPSGPAPAASDSQGGVLFASPDGQLRVIYVEAATPLGGYHECTDWVGQIRRIIRDWADSHPSGARITLTGRPAYLAEVATGMERDMTGSVAGTAVVIAALFGLAYRSLKPLLWLLILLALTLALTIGAAGVFWGELNVISLGFAAIVLGLVADYAIVLYEEHRIHPKAHWRQVRQSVWRGIAGGAATTAFGFFAISFEAIPGLQQLGILVATGTVIGAVLTLVGYLPLVAAQADETSTVPTLGSTDASATPAGAPGARLQPSAGSLQLSASTRFIAWTATAGLVGTGVWLMLSGLPRFSHSSDPLRPVHSEAYQAGERLASKLGTGRDPWWILVQAEDENRLADKLRKVREAFEPYASVGQLLLPDALWPNPDAQGANRAAAAALVASGPALRDAALEAGFTTNALSLMTAVLDQWQRAQGGVLWPTNSLGVWTLNRFAARAPDGFLVMGMVLPRQEAGSAEPSWLRAAPALGIEGVWFTSWSVLGSLVSERVISRLVPVLITVSGLLIATLWITFGRFRDVVLNAATMLAAGTALMAWMRVAGWNWNLMNLVGLPLLLGAGVDYAIHIQLALRRSRGDVRAAVRSTGRALFLCAATTMVGFGSLAGSSSNGLVSLGQLCAAGIGLVWMVAVFLLPSWWLAWERLSPWPNTHPGHQCGSQQSSALYRDWGWRAGARLANRLPPAVAQTLFSLGAQAYWLLSRRRRLVVESNLLPVCGGNAAAAARCARRLHAEFGRKLADLWRYEAGAAAEAWFNLFTGWEALRTARDQRRGMLLVTAHLGNWELGAPLLVGRGIPLMVLSQPEPDSGLGAQREQARALRGVRTLIVGTDPFAILPAVQHLQQGGAVALLIDRPGEGASVEVELFGRPFRASVAAAELARASGCTIFPVAIVRGPAGYQVRVEDPIAYERATLRAPQARRQLTQEIVRALEPIIRQHPEQWFHFVPVWPTEADPRSAAAPS